MLTRVWLCLTLCILLSSCIDGGGVRYEGSDGGGDLPDGIPGCALSCGTECCTDSQMCLVDQCVAECPDVSQLCGASQEFCCGSGEACFADSCVVLGDPCEFTEDCDVGEYCEPLLDYCIPIIGNLDCEFVPPPGMFDPTTACRWTPPAGAYASYEEVVATPSVANLTDDNGDGFTDTDDIPDIVFVSFDRSADGCCTTRGVLRVVSGLCDGNGGMNTIATIGDGNPWIDNSSGIALGNLDLDTDLAEHPPEIVATMRVGAVAYKRATADGSQWTELWRNTTLPSNSHTRGGAQPAIADLNGDGRPEVIIGNVVLDGLTGVKVWDGLETVGAGAGIGNNAFLGPASTVADLNLDGTPEVIAGNTVYDGPTGAEVWTYTYVGDNSSCGGSLPCDGFNAVGNFDADDEGEVVMVRRGEVFVLHHDGTQLHRVPIPVDNCSANESGPPTVADFDGDGRVEIGTASADFYVVVDFDCVPGAAKPAECDQNDDWILWKTPNQDCSSRATGSSVFDFDGDGEAEVVYADENSFRIFKGKDGTILYEDLTHSSNTRMEMPIVVDVDNDGKSEVVVPEPNHNNSSRGGIDVWEDSSNNWVRTRRIWNQHTYHVTNIDENGQVPRVEPPNWLQPRLNNFRQNVQPDGLFAAPDMAIVEIRVDMCLSGTQAVFAVEVVNQGAIGVAAGIPVFIEAFDGATSLGTDVVYTTRFLLPSQRESLLVDMTVGNAMSVTVEAYVDSDGMGGSQYNECDETNNDASAMLDGCNLPD